MRSESPDVGFCSSVCNCRYFVWLCLFPSNDAWTFLEGPALTPDAQGLAGGGEE
jgi:hypothetical protein